MKTVLTLKSLVLFSLFLFFSTIGVCQNFTFVPDNQLEQHPCGAINICSDTFGTFKSYRWRGETGETGEWYVHWLKVQIAASGKLRFLLTPKLTSDNYNFEVYSSVNGACSELEGSSPIRSNTCLPLPTYLNGSTGLTANSTLEHTDVSPLSKEIDAVSGNTYFIKVINYGPPIPGTDPFTRYYATKGYNIDFSASTCTFIKGAPVQIDSISLNCTNNKWITVHLSKSVKCSSIEDLASDFELDNGSVFMASGVGCDAENPLTRKINIQFAPYLAPGIYNLSVKTGTDGNTIVDMCDDELPVPETVSFLVPDLDSTIDLKICPQQLPYSWNGQLVNTSGINVASVTFPNFLGCDSIATLNLSVEDTMKATANISICAEELPYTWNGQTITVTGNSVGKYHTTTLAGCDSLITLNLSFIQPVSTTINLSGCGNLSFDGNNYTQSTSFNDTLTSTYGCDSVYRQVNIDIHPEIDPITVTIDTSGCGYLLLNGKIYTESIAVEDTVVNQFQCDSAYITYVITIFPNGRPKKAELLLTGCSAIEFEGRDYYTDTVFVKLYKSTLGCDSSLTSIKIKFENIGLSLITDPEFPVKGDYVTFRTESEFPYTIVKWLPEFLFAEQTAKQQLIKIKDDLTVVKVVGLSENGCLDTVTYNLNADSLIPIAVMPNAFSPNSDGINDAFTAGFVNRSGYLIERFQIFNRWGRLVYQDFGTRSASWDGTYGNKGVAAEMGTYFYYIDIMFINGTKQSFKGEVLLIR